MAIFNYRNLLKVCMRNISISVDIRKVEKVLVNLIRWIKGSHEKNIDSGDIIRDVRKRKGC